MSIHSKIMKAIFITLDDPELRHHIGEAEGWSREAQEVLAALDAFADEQEPTGCCPLCGTVLYDPNKNICNPCSCMFDEPEDWLTGNNYIVGSPEWFDDIEPESF